MNPVTFVGETLPGGTYVLRMRVEAPCEISFGRFAGGASIPIPAGEALYVGSAMARSGSMTLARRTLRHATRSSSKPAHTLQEALRRAYVTAGIHRPDETVPREKKLFWNIDYLLDDLGVQLGHIILLRSTARLEDEAAALLSADMHCSPIAPGLGAHDRPGETHLFRVEADAAWWADLPSRLAGLIAQNDLSPGRR